MKKRISSLEDIEHLKGEYLGEGREGICYKMIDSNLVLKIYKEGQRPEELIIREQESPYIAFPKDIFVDFDGKILASTMPFMLGKKLENGFLEGLEISKLKEAYNVILLEIQKYSDIYMSDLCLDNIFYSELTNRFYLIDTTLWKQWDDSVGLNIARINQNLSHALYKNIAWLEDYDFWKDNKNFRYNFKESKNEGFVSFIELLEEAIEQISNYFEKEIITIGDLKPKMKKKS